ncbi:MAG: AEC family transporter [Anaerolineae bacterium]
MYLLFNVVLPVFVIAGLGIFARLWLDVDIESLSRVAFRIFIPALVFEALLNSTFSAAEFGSMALAVALLSAILFLIGLAAARILNLSAGLRGALVITLVLANVGAYGLPVLSFARGEEVVVPGSIYIIVFNALLITLSSVYLATLAKSSARTVIGRVVKNPVIYAALLGVIARLTGIIVPETVIQIVDLLGDAGTPVLLLVLGMQLIESVRGEWRAHQIPALIVIVVVRLMLAPLLALLLADWLALPDLFRFAFVIDSAMPSAILTTVLAMEFEADASFVSLAVFTTTLLSLLTVTLWLHWML